MEKNKEELRKVRNTSILAPEYYYKIAKRDFGSTSRFFRVAMEGYIQQKYGKLIKSEDIISDNQITNILISEQEDREKFVNEGLEIVAENHNQEDSEEASAEEIITETLVQESNEKQKKILAKKDYFETMIKRAAIQDVIPPFDYIEKEYGVGEESVLNAVEYYSNHGVFDIRLILEG